MLLYKCNEISTIVWNFYTFYWRLVFKFLDEFIIYSRININWSILMGRYEQLFFQCHIQYKTLTIKFLENLKIMKIKLINLSWIAPKKDESEVSNNSCDFFLRLQSILQTKIFGSFLLRKTVRNNRILFVVKSNYSIIKL